MNRRQFFSRIGIGLALGFTAPVWLQKAALWWEQEWGRRILNKKTRELLTEELLLTHGSETPLLSMMINLKRNRLKVTTRHFTFENRKEPMD